MYIYIYIYIIYIYIYIYISKRRQRFSTGYILVSSEPCLQRFERIQNITCGDINVLFFRQIDRQKDR